MIIFDIGAACGEWSIPYAIQNQDNIVHAFDPFIGFNKILLDKVNKLQLTNYHIVSSGAYKTNQDAKLYISSRYGRYSILQSSRNALTEWPGHDNFQIQNILDIHLIRLDNYIEDNKISSIDIINIDAEGSDLAVLEGLGNKINMIKSGCVKAAQKPDILYKEQNLANDTIDFLRSKEFIITNVITIDRFYNEVQISFLNKNG